MIYALVFLCVAIEAVFTALEVALGATPRARWRTLAEEAREAERDAHTPEETARAHRTGVKAASLSRLTEHPERLSLLFISITTLALWAASSMLAGIALGRGWAWWVLGLEFVAVLFAAEVLPLLIAAQYGETVALALANPVARVLGVSRPVMILPSALGAGLARILGARPEATTQVTTNELRTALAAAEEEGVIESEERAMLEGAIAFREKPIQTVMTPLADVLAVRDTDDLATVLRVSLDNGHSRLPVFGAPGAEASPTAAPLVVGVLATKDLLRPLRNGAGDSFKARDAMRAPFFLPADTRIAAALEQLRHERTLMGVVVQNGEPLGIVTLEDLLEELVGEIEDEWDDEAALRVETPPAPHDADSGIREPQFVMACDRTHEVTIRETERFWRESGAGLLRLRTESGELAPPDETLDAYAARFMADPVDGERTVVGETRPESDEAGEEEDEKSEAAKNEVPHVIADVVLEARNVLEGRLHALALREVARAVTVRGGKGTTAAGEQNS